VARKLTDMSRTLERRLQATDITTELCIDKQVSGIGNKHFSRCSRKDKLTKTSVANVHPFGLFVRQRESGFNLQTQFFSHKTSSVLHLINECFLRYNSLIQTFKDT
jgi:hypothetical protein